MNITVKYFAALREALGCAEEQLQTRARNIAELRDELMAKGEPYRSALAPGQAIRCASNLNLVGFDALIQNGDEIAFFPPVTGG